MAREESDATVRAELEAARTEADTAREEAAAARAEAENTREALVQAQAEAAEAAAALQAREEAVPDAVAASDAGEATAASTADGDVQAELQQLRARLEQTEMRARRAYAAAEASEAALKYAKESGGLFVAPPEAASDEMPALRDQVSQLLSKLRTEEDLRRKAEADLMAARAGVDADALDDAPPEEVPSVDPRPSVAARTPSSGGSDADEWR